MEKARSVRNLQYLQSPILHFLLLDLFIMHRIKHHFCLVAVYFKFYTDKQTDLINSIIYFNFIYHEKKKVFNYE